MVPGEVAAAGGERVIRVVIASLLLVIGVGLMAATAETQVLWWAAGGGLCLMFVPPLVADAVLAELKRNRGAPRGHA